MLSLCLVLLIYRVPMARAYDGISSLPFARFLQSVRYNENGEKVRVIFEFSDAIPEYHFSQTRNPSRIVLEFPQARAIEIDENIHKIALSGIRVTMPSPELTRAVIDLAYPLPTASVFALEDPPRIVVDIPKLYEEKSNIFVAPGIRYIQLERGMADGPLRVDVLDIDLNDPTISVRPALAGDRLSSRDTVSGISRRYGAIAGINGIYFAPDGRPLGLMVIDGYIVSGPLYRRSAFGITSDRKVLIDRVDLQGRIILPGGREIKVSGVNSPRGTNDVIIYTSHWGDFTRTNGFGLEFSVVDNTVVEIGRGNLQIPRNGFVVSCHGNSVAELGDIAMGDQIHLDLRLDPDWISQGVIHAVGAGPRLVASGVVTITSQEELFKLDVTAGRAPRTAIGVTADNHLIMLVATGRQQGISVGLRLDELARLMIEFGAVDAINLDGGGSSTLAIRGLVMNLPSEGRERKVGDAILVFKNETLLPRAYDSLPVDTAEVEVTYNETDTHYGH